MLVCLYHLMFIFKYHTKFHLSWWYWFLFSCWLVLCVCSMRTRLDDGSTAERTPIKIILVDLWNTFLNVKCVRNWANYLITITLAAGRFDSSHSFQQQTHTPKGDQLIINLSNATKHVLKRLFVAFMLIAPTPVASSFGLHQTSFDVFFSLSLDFYRPLIYRNLCACACTAISREKKPLPAACHVF